MLEHLDHPAGCFGCPGYFGGCFDWLCRFADCRCGGIRCRRRPCRYGLFRLSGFSAGQSRFVVEKGWRIGHHGSRRRCLCYPSLLETQLDFRPLFRGRFELDGAYYAAARRSLSGGVEGARLGRGAGAVGARRRVALVSGGIVRRQRRPASRSMIVYVVSLVLRIVQKPRIR